MEKYVAEGVGQNIIKLTLHIRWATKVETITLCLQSNSQGCWRQNHRVYVLQYQVYAAYDKWKIGFLLWQGEDIQIQDQILQGAEVNGNWGHSALKWIYTVGYQNGLCFRYFTQLILSLYAEFVLLTWCWLYHSKMLKLWSFPLSSQITRCKYDIFFKDMILGSMLISLHYIIWWGENIFLILKISTHTKQSHPKQLKHYVLLNLSVFFSWICQHFINLNTSAWSHYYLELRIFFVNSAFYSWTPRNWKVS